jgi:ferrous iron transport protein B
MGAGKVVVAALIVVWALMALPAPGGGAAADRPVENSAYGWAARSAAPVLAPAGFGDWHLVSALAGGFVAKEVVVGQLAQSYAVDASAEPSGLVAAIRSTLEETSGGHPGPAGLAFMVFVLGYTPCVATVAEQRRILGTRWTVAAVGTQMAVAWLLAVAVFQVGRLWW